MIGIILVTHGRLAEEFIAAVEHVVGKMPYIKGVCIEAEDDMQQRYDDIKEAIVHVSQGTDGVVILTDMFGGTPSNLAISAMDEGKIEVIAGVNLPMLVKLATVRETLPLKECVTQVREAGRKYIAVASDFLSSDDSN